MKGLMEEYDERRRKEGREEVLEILIENNAPQEIINKILEKS